MLDSTIHARLPTQDYTVLVRDLATTLLFLVVFLKSHSEELRTAGKKKKMEEEEEGEGDGEGEGEGEENRKCFFYTSEEVSSNINALFAAVADIFHCWFSSPVRCCTVQWNLSNPHTLETEESVLIS